MNPYLVAAAVLYCASLAAVPLTARSQSLPPAPVERAAEQEADLLSFLSEPSRPLSWQQVCHVNPTDCMPHVLNITRETRYRTDTSNMPNTRRDLALSLQSVSGEIRQQVLGDRWACARSAARWSRVLGPRTHVIWCDPVHVVVRP